MKFIEYKFKAANGSEKCKRLQYLIEQFSLDKSISTAEFAHKVNDAYYKFCAPLYTSGYETTLRSVFSRFLRSLPPGRDIVDVGAGTGASFRTIRDIGYKYRKYFFIEPFKDMLDQFSPPATTDDGSSLVLLNDPLESVTLDSSHPKIFILAGVLRVIVNLDEFLADLKGKMSHDDVLLLPIEPNNESFSSWTISSVASALHARTFGYYDRVASGIRRRLSAAKQRGATTPHHLERSLRFLIENDIVSPNFTQQHLYAIVNYHNYQWWRFLDVPDSSNEGFFTPGEVAHALDATIAKFEAFKFFQFEPTTYAGKLVEACAKRALPSGGSYFSCLYAKR